MNLKYFILLKIIFGIEELVPSKTSAYKINILIYKLNLVYYHYICHRRGINRSLHHLHLQFKSIVEFCTLIEMMFATSNLVMERLN